MQWGDAVKAVVFALGLLALSAPAAMAEEPIKWVVSNTAGSRIEIPSFFVDGKVEPIRVTAEGKMFLPKNYPDAYLQQYQADNSLKPYDYIEIMLVENDADYETDYDIAHPYYKVTYRFDKPSLGAISGTSAYGTVVFYGMCQRHNTRKITCFDMSWNKKDQAIFGPIAERIARSFRRNH